MLRLELLRLLWTGEEETNRLLQTSNGYKGKGEEGKGNLA